MTKREELEYALVHGITDEQEELVREDWRAFWDDPMSFIDDRVLDMVCKDLGLPLPSKKQKEIEDILNLKITHEQLIGISKEWKRFYEEPKGSDSPSIVTSVRLWLTDTYSKNVKKENRKMGLIKNGDLQMKHESPDGTLQWGKLGNEFCYIRLWGPDTFNYNATELPLIDSAPEVKSKLDSIRELFAVYTRFDDGTAMIIRVLVGTAIRYDWGVGMLPKEYRFAGFIPMVKDTSELTNINEYIRFIKHAYVSWYISGAGHHIPIMWQNTKDDVNRPTTPYPALQMGLICSTDEKDALVTVDNCQHTMSLYEQYFQPVDLEIEEDKRFEVINLATGAQVVYNRNYKAYNGNVSAAVKLLPLIFEEWYIDITKFFEGREVYQDVLRIADEGTVEKQVILTTNQAKFDSDTEGEVQAPVLPGDVLKGSTNYSLPKDNGYKPDEPKMHEDNILLRAARASDSRYE